MILIASFRSSLFMDPSPNHSSSYSLVKTTKGHGGRGRPPSVHIRSHTSLASVLHLRNRARTRTRRNVADFRCAGRKRWSRDKKLITLGRSRTAGHASSRKGIAEGVRPRETIGKRLQERDNRVFFLIGQAEITGGHIDIVRHLGHRPAVYFFDRSIRAMSGSNVERKPLFVARVVEVDELLQALDVAVVKELLLEIRPGRLGGGTPRRGHSYIARRRHLHLAVGQWCKLSPTCVRVGPGTGTASEEGPHAQVSKAEAEGIRNEAKGIRRGLIIDSVPGIQGQALIGRAEASEQRVYLGGHAVVALPWGQSGSSSIQVA